MGCYDIFSTRYFFKWFSKSQKGHLPKPGILMESVEWCGMDLQCPLDLRSWRHNCGISGAEHRKSALSTHCLKISRPNLTSAWRHYIECNWQCFVELRHLKAQNPATILWHQNSWKLWWMFIRFFHSPMISHGPPHVPVSIAMTIKGVASNVDAIPFTIGCDAFYTSQDAWESWEATWYPLLGNVPKSNSKERQRTALSVLQVLKNLSSAAQGYRPTWRSNVYLDPSEGYANLIKAWIWHLFEQRASA